MKLLDMTPQQLIDEVNAARSQLRIAKEDYAVAHDAMIRAGRQRDEMLEALTVLRGYNLSIQLGRINYRPEDHIAVADAAIAKATGSPPAHSERDNG